LTYFKLLFVELRRITYENTAASIIEVIARKETVHPIRDLSDLRNRLSNPMRRCFAFFHPSLPDAPLVFVHVALVPNIPGSMEELDRATTGAMHERNMPTTTTTAAFYSINTTQKGLSGVDLGSSLIKRVTKVLVQDSTLNLDTFATLSPLPGFRSWFEPKVSMQIQMYANEDPLHQDTSNHLNKSRNKFATEIISAAEQEQLSRLFNTRTKAETLNKLLKLLKDRDWYENAKAVAVLKPIMMKKAASYLSQEKRRRKPLDSVAKFHIGNGADMYRLNFLADKSRKVSLTKYD
jgi:malonyl-CoA decarboxylase